MFELRQTQQNHQAQQTPQPSERRWDPARQQGDEQRALIRELGQLQITPSGFVYLGWLAHTSANRAAHRQE
jgi:hypothetical protein